MNHKFAKDDGNNVVLAGRAAFSQTQMGERWAVFTDERKDCRVFIDIATQMVKSQARQMMEGVE